MKKFGAFLTLISMLTLPVITSAQVAALTPNSGGACLEVSMNLKLGANANDNNTKLQILNLQSLLARENILVPATELGTYGAGTAAAVSQFQEKYADEILAPFALTKGSGYAGAITRLKLKALYGCRGVSAVTSTTPISLAITSIKLDSDGVTATFCNNGKSDLSTAPFRIRLNGINRDFEIIGAQKAGQCDTEVFGYGTWGITYNQGNTYSAVGIIDPNGVYKTSSFATPLSSTATLNVPALPGYHLSVRSLVPKTNGIQATFCNLGTLDVNNFPIKVTVNGNSKDLDLGVQRAGQCPTVTWTYDTFSLSYMPNTIYSVTVVTDPYNLYKEVNELDNTATVVGMP